MYNHVESNPTLTHVTFSGNVAPAGGGIRNEISSPTIVNSIMWGNTGGEITNTTYSIPVVTYSIVQGGYAGTGNLNSDPFLGALVNNGSLTQTMAIGSGSPAINAGDDATCATTDQRGALRPQGGHCDIGAYELVPLDPSKLSFQEVATGLNKPVSINHAGDGSGRLFIIERGGRIRILKNGTLLATPFLDIQSIVRSTSSEQGLLSLAFHPSYASNGKFYVVYTAPRNGDANGSVLTLKQYHISGNPDIADANSGSTILTIDHPTQTNHNGGTITFGNDGYLYWSTGDGGGGGDPSNNAQDLTKLLGKVLRIDVNSGSPYSIPATNPFYSSSNVNTKLVWVYGLRNPWRMSFDRVTHDLYIGDVGQSVREEIDFQPANSTGGENYGWRIMEGSLCYNSPGGCDQTGKVLPVAEYNHNPDCSVTGGYVYRGSNSLAFAGHYLYGDYCSGKLFSIYNNLPAGWSTPIQLVDTPYFISTFGEDEAGELYLADYSTGKIYKLQYQDPFYIISGNAGVADAILNYRDGTVKSVTADGSGNYSITVPYGWSGTVTPYKSGYTFMPLNRFYNNVQSDQPAQNYTATTCVGCADVNVLIGGNQVGAYTLASSQSMRDTYSLDAGPMKVASTNGVPLIAALRDAYLVNSQVESFAQLMGLPQEQLSDTYYFPAYNNVTLSGQLRFANVDTVPTTVTVTIAGVVRGTYPLNPNESARVTYPLDAGPVKVQSAGGAKIIAALRDAYFVNNQLESFVQLMGLPKEQLSTTYLFPAYNNVTLSGQLRFGNVDTVATTVTVTIAGTLQGTYDLDPNESVRVTYPLDAGPVEVKSSGAKIIAALRDAYYVNGRLESFAQLMGLPQEQLSDTYLLPAYNNVTLSGQLRFANVDSVPTTVTVTIAGVVRGTYDLDPNESVRVTYPLDTGPVEVKSSGAQIIVALRDAYYVSNSLVSFVQLMGLPAAGLSDTYWFPAYNNVTLSGQLRFAVP